MSPDKNRVLKINNARAFLIKDLSLLEREPTADSPYFDENLELLLRFLPDLKDAEICFRRYCWYVVTFSSYVSPSFQSG
jgi:hypothetical protein